MASVKSCWISFSVTGTEGGVFAPAVQHEGNSDALQWLLRAELVNGEQVYSSSIKYLHSGFTQEPRQRERQV